MGTYLYSTLWEKFLAKYFFASMWSIFHNHSVYKLKMTQEATEELHALYCKVGFHKMAYNCI